ncbi:MAG: cardiolipin synthase [Hydrogenovibrio sp.]
MELPAFEMTPFWVLYYFIYIFLVLTAVLHMLYQKRSPQNLTVWLLTLLLLPYIGILLYLIFGSRKVLYKHNKPNIIIPSQPQSTAKENTPENDLADRIGRLLISDQIANLSLDNRIALYNAPEETFNEFMQAVQHAQTCIHIETYILELDVTGNAILNALIDKARQGVEVRLLMDAIGSFGLYRQPKPLRALVEAGGQYAFFHPLFKNFFNSQINLRNHRKLYLFDHQTGFTGGMNLSNDYFGTLENTPKQGRWQDLMFKIQGPVLAHYHIIFNEDWRYTTNEKLNNHQAWPFCQGSGARVQAVPSGPDIHKDALFESLLQALYAAENDICILSPYFIPDSSIMNALMIAIKRGVTVTLVTPEKSDHIIFDLGRSSYMHELSDAGGRIHLYKGGMLHAKLVLIDRQAMMFGTANLDYRSLFINHELANWVYNRPLIDQCWLWAERLIKHSFSYQTPNSRGRRLFENFTRIFAPIL